MRSGISTNTESIYVLLSGHAFITDAMDPFDVLVVKGGFSVAAQAAQAALVAATYARGFKNFEPRTPARYSGRSTLRRRMRRTACNIEVRGV
jgi:hypothetical protein